MVGRVRRTLGALGRFPGSHATTSKDVPFAFRKRRSRGSGQVSRRLTTEVLTVAGQRRSGIGPKDPFRTCFPASGAV